MANERLINKRPANYPSKTKNVSGANNSDYKIEELGAKDDGEVIECLNGRMSNVRSGNIISRESIGGELIAYFNDTGAVEYVCIGSCSVNEKLVEFWTDFAGVEDDIITINGVINSQADWLFDKTKHLQIDTNENKIGGEVYCADDLNVPFYIFIKDMEDNLLSGSGKYFSPLFRRALYEINLQIPIDQIVFKGVVDVGEGSGLPVGQYSYSHRYGSTSGERTEWSPYTPLAFAPENYDTAFPIFPNDSYPYLKTEGNDSDPLLPRRYGLKLNVRINNIYEYDFIEIKRISYNASQPFGYVPQAFIVKSEQITPGQVSIFEYIDCVANQNQDIAIPPEEEANNLSIIERAKAIRYFFNKIELGNIKYASRLVDDTTYHFIEDPVTLEPERYPIIRDIGQAGHKNDLNHCYMKSYMNNELYSFRVVFWDANLQRSFVAPIIGMEDFRFPNRRDILDDGNITVGPSDMRSWNESTGAVKVPHQRIADYLAGGIYTSFESYTFEVVDCLSLVSKPQIIDIGQIEKNIYNSTEGLALYPPYWTETMHDAGYKPWTPTKPFDYRNFNNQNPNDSVWTNDFDPGTYPSVLGYNPCLFGPRYNSLGVAITGLDQVPSWAKAFSIVRSKPANRVVCQGLAFYKLITDTLDETVYNNFSSGKSLSNILCSFPDIDNAVVPANIISDIMANPQNYKIELVSPLGFASEKYSAKDTAVFLDDAGLTVGGVSTKTDYAVWCRIQTESDITGVKANMNGAVGDSCIEHGWDTSVLGVEESKVGFGAWRNKEQSTIDGGQLMETINGDKQYGIKSFNKVITEANVNNLYDVALTEDIYYYEALGYANNYTTNRERHEPVYIVNIVRDGATVSDIDFDSSLQTGAYVKLETTIGFGDGTVGQQFGICGEREEDFSTGLDIFKDQYIWVEDGTGNFVRWIDVTYKNPVQILIIDAAIAGGIPYTSGAFAAVLIYGKYTYAAGAITIDGSITTGREVQIRYDNNFPIIVFGGDTFHGMVASPIVNRELLADGGDNGGNIITEGGTQMLTKFPLPYPVYNISKNIVRVNHTDPDPLLFAVQDPYDIAGLDANYRSPTWQLRQLIAIYDCSCRSAIHLSYGKFFPNVGYVMRPATWVGATPIKDQFIFEEYSDDYGEDEKDRWIHGGIKFAQFPINIDLARDPVHDKYVSGSTTYIKENEEFKTRIIWSQTRPIQNYGSPNLKAFRQFNIFDLSDKYGEIKRFYTERSSAFQENLYALTDYNICLAMTRKRTLSGADGTALTIKSQEDDLFILDQIWVGNQAMGGLHNEYWMSCAESDKALYFANKNSVFKFSNNIQEDIANKYNYFKRIKDLLLNRNASSFEIEYYDRISGVWDREKSEYWIGAQFEKRIYTIVDGLNPFDIASDIYPVWEILSNVAEQILFIQSIYDSATMYLNITGTEQLGILDANLLSHGIFSPGDKIEVVFVRDTNSYSVRKIDSDNIYSRDNFVFSFTDSEKIKGWNGIYDYKYDKYCQILNNVYGSKSQILVGNQNITSSKLDTGLTINGDSIDFHLYSSVNPELIKSVEFIRIRVNSNIKPTNVFFFDKDDILLQVGNITEAMLKNYHGFENYIPKHVTQRVRRQGIYLTFKIKHKSYDKFNVSFVSFDYKVIR